MVKIEGKQAKNKEEKMKLVEKQNSNYDPTALTTYDPTYDLNLPTKLKNSDCKIPGETEVKSFEKKNLSSDDNSDCLDNKYSSYNGQAHPDPKEQENVDITKQKYQDRTDQKKLNSKGQIHVGLDRKQQTDPDGKQQKDGGPINRKTMRNESSTTGSMRQENFIWLHWKTMIFSIKKLLFGIHGILHSGIHGIMPFGIHGITAILLWLLLMFCNGSTAYSQTNTTNDLVLEIQNNILKLSFETHGSSCLWTRRHPRDETHLEYLANGNVKFNDAFTAEFRPGKCVLVFKNTTKDDLQNYCYIVHVVIPEENTSACKRINPLVHTCIKKWSPWSSCSKKCGGGSRKRTGICKKDLGVGYLPELESDTCNADKCPTDGSSSVVPVRCNAISFAIAIIITIINIAC